MIDTELSNLIEQERARQEKEICLIASENYVSKDILEAQGSILTNKYAEGYPNKRYYGGCYIVDKVEQLAIDRCCKAFNCKYANVQPHSGSQANQAVYAALLQPGDRVLAMDLNAGAHITHVSKASYTSKIYKSEYYGLNEKGTIDYTDLANKLGSFKPHLLIVGGSSYPREIDFKYIREMLNTHNSSSDTKCYMMVDMAHIAGLVAGGVHQNPVDYADVVTSTSHKTLAGPRSGFIITNSEEIIKKVNTAVFPRCQGGPLMHVIAGKAICFDNASKDSFKEYAKNIIKNRDAMQDVLLSNGVDLVSGGSDNHMLLLDLRKHNITGIELEKRLESIGIITNKNTVPNDTRPKSETSGLRIGTPAVTTRGFDTEDCKVIASIIARAVVEKDWEPKEEEVLFVKTLCERKPIYRG